MASHEQSSRAEALLESGGEEEADYESDSEEGTSALALRRRVASDDEEDDQEMNAERRPAYYDDDVEDQGVPPAEDDEEEEEEYEDAEEAVGLATRRRDMTEEEEEDDGGEELAKHQHEGMEDVTEKPAASAGNVEGSSKEGAEGEKKDAEPFVVPTAGAFYMHDDRFRYNGVARPRRSAGGRKLWEAKDEKPWVHDRFEELKLNEEVYYGQGVRGRRGRGRQGRGQGRGKDLGHARGRGGRERVVEDALHLSRRGPGRGRGLRRAKMDDYEFKESHSAGNRGLASSSRESSSSSLMPKPAPLQPTTKPPEAGSKKPTTSSILNSASPPFFPTGAISHNLKGVLAGTSKGAEEKLFGKAAPQVGRLVSTSRTGMEKGMAGVSAASMTRPSSSPGNITSLAHVSNTAEVNTGLHRSLARGPNSSQQQLLKIGSGSMLPQQRPVRADGNTQHMVEQSLLSAASQQTVRGTTQAQPLRVQQPHQQLQTTIQGQISKGQPLQSQSVVSPVSLSAKSAVDLKAAPSSPGNKLGSGASGRGTQATTVQTGRGSFVYGGSSLTNGLRSVVQFAGQPQSGLGVPAVGVALPGYSSQPQFGFPNSEVTWIPILAGGGSLSSNYSSPYIAVDGGSPAVYYTQQASQPSSFPVPGREMNGSKTATSSSFKPPARPVFETEPDEFGQQRRRYSQMTFGEERR